MLRWRYLWCKQLYCKGRDKYAIIISLRNVINSNSLGNKKEPSNQKVTVDYKKIEDLYNDYKRERDKRNKKRNQIDAELGITFKPELYTNGKYYNKINPNFHDRERQFIEDKTVVTVKDGKITMTLKYKGLGLTGIRNTVVKVNDVVVISFEELILSVFLLNNFKSSFLYTVCVKKNMA